MLETAADGGDINQIVRIEDDVLGQQGAVGLTLGQQQVEFGARIEIGGSSKRLSQIAITNNLRSQNAISKIWISSL